MAAPDPQPRPAPPSPEPRKSQDDDHAVLAALAKGGLEESWLSGEEWVYVRSGLPERLLRDLRRGRYRIQADLDLHGLRVEDARLAVASFLQDARRYHWTCVRIIHGKGMGSPGQIPILKRLVGHWLQRHQEVLAFTQARPMEGGGGALRILLGNHRK